ncbi:hypothetical protein PF004_g5266 [Phytophthora fragariae]|uniref:CCHC-type domain-containing protein n=1 Tax=Phytophthora fragariae TaxID=53985 RepID=A0A6G0PG68_9STRA|nr:hypothetical protein PF004_g5266 [Phytophthora fragariae]
MRYAWAWELVTFAIEHPAWCGGVSRGGSSRCGGNGGRVGRRQGFDSCACWECGKTNHLKADCRSGSGSGSEKVSLAAGRADKGNSGTDESWILDSGSSVHSVSDLSLLHDAKKCSDTWTTANGSTRNVTCKGTAVIRTMIDGVDVEVDPTNVYFCKKVASNIISYASLEEKGTYLVQRGAKSNVERAVDRKRVFEVQREGRVLLVDGIGGCGRRERVNVVSPVAESSSDDAA